MGVLSRISTALLLSGSIALTACSTPGVRAVRDVEPGFIGYELLPSGRTDARTFSAEELNAVVESSFQGVPVHLFLSAHRAEHQARQVLAQHSTEEPSVAAWGSPGAGPGSWPLEIDLGVGEFPLDDGMHPVNCGPSDSSGFSSSLVRLTWREPLVGAFGIHGSAALARTQEEPLLEMLAAARLSWFTLGFHTSF